MNDPQAAFLHLKNVHCSTGSTKKTGSRDENRRVNTGPSPDSPFWVSLVEHTRVEIWKESLLMVQLPRLCMLLPVAEWAFSSNSAFVEGRLKYVAASSSFFASACGFNYGHVRSESQSTIPHRCLFYPFLPLILLTIMIFALYPLLNSLF